MESILNGHRLLVLICVLFITCILSCSDSSNGSGSNFEGELYITLLDAPAVYKKIEILIYRVWIYRSISEVPYLARDESTGRFDILELRNGINIDSCCLESSSRQVR